MIRQVGQVGQARAGQVGKCRQVGQAGQAQPGRAGAGRQGRHRQVGQAQAGAGKRRQVVIVVIVPCLVDITQLQFTARGGNTSLMTRWTSILLTKFCQYN